MGYISYIVTWAGENRESHGRASPARGDARPTEV